ncbi:electron transfer flavoprotein subunit alpha/FixB family protein [Paenibacillus contaminans]|uniref:Electron transfer flavoprotein subunit alpha/FixB family protein n=1 Tax=Paenibacillus contaminans TaxID=450362 RepID=A0A329MMW4_9BACL|nr:electron transfer flavoprotein subunit alpha/FixB family protein [Paenibacillus contaminans]RAV20636.1 electron transfer flavoprotein subunit alpha/FixB family protein [Paenibacillus contaminans]
MGRNVLVWAEVKDGTVRRVSLEALSAARTIAGADGNVGAACIGPSPKGTAELLAAHGADRIYEAADPSLAAYSTDGFTQALLQLIAAVSPDAVLAPHSARGKDVMPRAAARLQCGMISDCIQVAAVEGRAVFTRPIYAGKAFERRTFADGIMFATIRPNNIAPIDPDFTRTPERIHVPVKLADLRTVIKQSIRKSSGGVDLSEAKVIVSGGRGVKSEAGFAPLRELAETLGGAVGASRGACDAGYCDYALQIGQTGKVVTPDLYIACGISGAIQHLAGMSGSRIIVAVNKDPEAPIFQAADYGIVGDLFEVVPLLSQQIRSLQAGG